MDFAIKSDIGKQRELNEDYCSYFREEGNDVSLFVLADGMGGHNAGEVASKMAVDSVIKFISERFNLSLYNEDNGYVLNLITSAINDINSSMFNISSHNENYSGMGTTIVILAVVQDKAYIANVGDSRCYLISDTTMQQLTTDHSYIGELVRDGTISKAEARTHPKRNEITRAIGVSSVVIPDIVTIDIKPDSTFLLCSDGLTNELEEEEIREIVVSSKNAEASSKKLLNEVIKKGGYDNISVIVVNMSNT